MQPLQPLLFFSNFLFTQKRSFPSQKVKKKKDGDKHTDNTLKFLPFSHFLSPLSEKIKANEKIFGSNSEIFSRESLTELPIGRYDVPCGGGSTVTACHPEGQRLAHQDGIGLPVLSPVTVHAHPTRFGPLNAHPRDIPCTRDVGDQNQVKVTKAVDRESNPKLLPTWDAEKKK